MTSSLGALFFDVDLDLLLDVDDEEDDEDDLVLRFGLGCDISHGGIPLSQNCSEPPP